MSKVVPRIERILENYSQVLEEITRGMKETSKSRGADNCQVGVRIVALAAAKLEAARSALHYALTYGKGTDIFEMMTAAYAAKIFHELHMACYELSSATPFHRDVLHGMFHDEDLRRILEEFSSEAFVREIGREFINSGSANNCPLAEEHMMFRDSTRKFAESIMSRERVEHIHRRNLDVPEEVIAAMGAYGMFGLSIPEEFGGAGAGQLPMVLATEECSAKSLGALGSLLTRPEILGHAIQKGGTQAQKEKWLPLLASGELMVGVAVTEPNHGSDVASITLRATRTDGGWVLNGAKAWCTFAGRANILALLARTDPDPKLGYKGLSLFIVEKDPFPGHEFTMTQKGGGKITGKADDTIGYRGMHSYTLQFENYFVPDENLVGGEEGLGKGFYLQMGGFASGRLQTGGRATGLMQAALEETIKYAGQRTQFGKPISGYQNTEFEIGWMAILTFVGRHITYAAAEKMTENPDDALLAAMAKLISCRHAVEVSQRGQVLHGGWGYAEEYPISRYVVDALVLPIFEGVEPILLLKVIGPALLK